MVLRKASKLAGRMSEGVLLAALSITSVACGPRFDVVRQATVNPLRKDTKIVVDEPRVGTITVNGKPEKELTAQFSGSDALAWVGLLEVARQGIVDGLLEARGGLAFARTGAGPIARVEVTEIELAHQDPRAAPKTTLHGVLRLLSTDGTVLDEVRLTSTIEAEVVTEEFLAATRSRRFKRAGTELGSQAAHYLRARAGVP